MDWANEEYVKLYVRETADDLELSWEATALWRAMLIKFDRAGVLPVRNGWPSLARLVRIPLDVVERAGAELVADGRLRVIEGGFMAPNFTAAQTASKSDKLRQRESRDRRRETAMSRGVTSGHKVSHAVTDTQQVVTPVATTDTTLAQDAESTQPRHEVSQAVTRGHTASHDVTLALALASTSPPPLPPGDGVKGSTGVVEVKANPTRLEIAKETWGRFSEARVSLAAEFGLRGVFGFAAITPGSHALGFRDLEDRIREEGDQAQQVCWRVTEVRIAEARSTKNVEWLSEKAFTEKAWRFAKEMAPKWLAKQAANQFSGYTDRVKRKDGSIVEITYDAAGNQVATKVIPAEVAS